MTGLDQVWRGRMINFFQFLTQAATKVDRCAVVASLLATDPRKSDALGKELTQELCAIFRREKEEGVQPVGKEDVAEVLRRRFVTPKFLEDREAFRPHVVAAVKNISELDEQTRKDKKASEDRFARNFPFHPDLTDVFYTKWTNLKGFQRTRGILRTFALALRDAEKWDECPLVAANVFLGEPGKGAISEAARELTTVAATEEYEGKKQEWTGILEGELVKARDIQAETGALGFREIEPAVFATFLHSQLIGQRALTRELYLLLGERSLDSGPWPCDFSGAQNVRIILAKEPPPPSPPPPPPSGVLVAEAEFQPNQIQDLAEQVADIKKAAVGLELKFRLRIELGGVQSPSDEPVMQINQMLEEISDKLKLK